MLHNNIRYTQYILAMCFPFFLIGFGKFSLNPTNNFFYKSILFLRQLYFVVKITILITENTFAEKHKSNGRYNFDNDTPLTSVQFRNLSF